MIQDLTENRDPKKLRSNSRVWYIVIAVATLLAAGYVIYRNYLHDDNPLPPGEENMPAIKVIVSNGCGYESLATDYANYISKLNVEVVKLTDTPKPIYDKSLIVVRKQDEQDLKRLQVMTGIQRFTLAVNEASEAPFIIILGRDYQQFMKENQGGTFGR